MGSVSCSPQAASSLVIERWPEATLRDLELFWANAGIEGRFTSALGSLQAALGSNKPVMGSISPPRLRTAFARPLVIITTMERCDAEGITD